MSRSMMEIASSELKWNASFQGPAGERYLFMVHVRICWFCFLSRRLCARMALVSQ